MSPEKRRKKIEALSAKIERLRPFLKPQPKLGWTDRVHSSQKILWDRMEKYLSARKKHLDALKETENAVAGD